MIGSILTILVGIGLIVGSCFYLIPTAKKQVSGWTNFVNGFNGWVTTNWIWVLVILMVIVLGFIVLYIGLTQKK